MSDGYFPADADAEPRDGNQAALELGMVETAAAELAVVFANPLPEWDLKQHCEALTGIREARRLLADAEQGLSSSIGALMGEHTVIVDGLGAVTKHARKSRTQWDPDLYRAVLDTRLVDPDTGEVVEETPVDRILHVWRLGAPRVTALKARGIDADEWCSTERKPGWTIEVKA